ncbi:hypothetical protein GCM10018790_68100 [Kitasatospora xanthocidica]|uniref:hypothetical protein n=1 Tax=Kitasatospora xanthocidica TaxID=83382 RepID=UPI00167970BA|nr:hypothetical protein [Kitasatospora xanthocidica]GHF80736.1 hypothetical protein GCM10018790_68100 [Kitasatospora xanthocidica]
MLINQLFDPPELPDRTVEQDGTVLLHGKVGIPVTDPLLDGHYPGFPLVPGLFLVQHVHALASAALERRADLPLVLEKARFLRPVRAGEQVLVTVRLTPAGPAGPGASATDALATAELRADGQPAAEFRIRYPEGRPDPVGTTGNSTTAGDATEPAGTLHRIKATIPHRHPVLLVDRVVEVEPGSRLLARKAVTAAEPCYAGLDDDAPAERYAYPAGQLLESWAQAAVLLACWQRPNPYVLTGKVALLAAVKDSRVLAAVHPGQVVEHEVRIVRDLGDTVILGGSSTADGRPVLEVGQFTVALRGAEVLRAESADGSTGDATGDRSSDGTDDGTDDRTNDGEG